MATPVLTGAAQTTQSSWQAIGQIGGPTQAVAVQGNYAYVGVGLRLMMLDVSNPAALREVGASTPFPYFVEDVAIGGKFAYVAAGGGGLRVVDISDPAHPNEVGHWTSPGYAEGVAVAGGVVYLADGPYGLRVIDVRNPAQPIEVGSAYPMNYAFKVAVNGHYAYVAAAGAGLLIADVTDPAHPVEVGSLDTPGYAYGIGVGGNTVYVADGWEGVRIVNVSDPVHPSEIGFYKTPGWAFGVAISGNLAYVADAFKGLRVLDVSIGSRPKELGSSEAEGGHAGAVVVQANTAYIADRNWGLRIVDVSKTDQCRQIGTYHPLSDAWAVDVAGRYAYVGAGYLGLWIIDISDPSHPVQAGVYDADGNVVGVVVSGKYAYLAVGGGRPGAGLHIVDVSTPALPAKVGFFAISPYFTGQLQGIPRDIKVVENIAYITNEPGLMLFDISDPTKPTFLSFTLIEPFGYAAIGLQVSGKLAYVAKENIGLAIVDVSNPSAPSVIGIDSVPKFAQDVDVAGKHAYVADLYSQFLRIVDVSDPQHPTTVGSFKTTGSPVGVTASGELVYVGDGGAGIQVVDVSDASRPTLTGTFNTAGYGRKVALADKYIYVADGIGGLLVLEKTTGSMVYNPELTRLAVANSDSGESPLKSELRSQYLSPLIPSHGVQGSAKLSRESRPPEPEHYPATVVGTSAPQLKAATASFVVTSSGDSGPGSLRSLMERAAKGDTITFDPVIFPASMPTVIHLMINLPAIAQGLLTIDGSNAGVAVDGSALPPATDGFVITSSGNAIRGLEITGFPGDSIVLRDGARENTIGGDRKRGAGPHGEGNLIAGNHRGVFIYGMNTDGNSVMGNYFGTGRDGNSLWSNHDACIAVGEGARNNQIGGTSVGQRNLIVGCGGPHGVLFYGEGTDNNRFIGNYVGVDVSGKKGLGGASCVSIIQGASDNQIGGLTPPERNIISGSGREGVCISDVGTTGNKVLGNYIGTNADGDAAIANTLFGIWIQFGASRTLIQQNVISGNNQAGIAITDTHCDYNTMIGNLIGTNASGTAALGNDGGILIALGCRFNRVGGTATGERNIISGNRGWGNISLGGRAGEGNFVIGNFIGTDITGTKAISASQDQPNGINLGDDCRHSFIGGATDQERNLIAGNAGSGIRLEGLGVEYNFIIGNYVGTDFSGTVALPNLWRGIELENAEHNVIQANTVAYNKESGVLVSGYPYNAIRRNSIHGHIGPGIGLLNGGNKEIRSPCITAVAASSMSGTTCVGCTAEVFSDAEDEGRVYEGTTIADASGGFTLSKGSSFAGPNITATATDRDGNTSEFSLPSEVPSGLPGKATLLSPSGTISTVTPTYTWNAVRNATWYQLRVNDSVASPKVQTWYTSTQAGCASGTGTCSVTPSTAAAPGTAQWWIQTWNDAGYGPWSDAMSFTVAGGAPGKASLISPSGTVSALTPTYVWNAVASATWYQLWVNDSSTSTGKIITWYTAAQAGCAAGTGSCSVTPTTALATGSAQWWIQTWNEFGYGPWSDGMSFTVWTSGPPGKATLLSPSGTISTTTPTYTWNAVASSTWYYLWVNDCSGVSRIQVWYTAAQAGCSTGTGVCSVTPGTALAPGASQWWIQTWNDYGYGPWSNGMSFIIQSAAR